MLYFSSNCNKIAAQPAKCFIDPKVDMTREHILSPSTILHGEFLREIKEYLVIF